MGSLPVLGLDPGSDGAAVLLDEDGSLLGAWAWIERRQDKKTIWELRFLTGSERVRDLARVGTRIACQIPSNRKPFNLVVEGLFVGKDPAACLDLSFSAGLVASPLAALAEGPIGRPEASVWRSRVLFLERASTEVAKDAAARWATKHYPDLGDLLGISHVCEAACIAFFGLPSATQYRLIALRKRVA